MQAIVLVHMITDTSTFCTSPPLGFYVVTLPLPLGEGGQGDGVNATEKRNMIICITNLSELAQLFLVNPTSPITWV